MTIDATGGAGAGSMTTSGDWPAIAEWAGQLATTIGREQPTEHVAVFVFDNDANGLRLAAQVWGAGEDTGEVVVGDWLLPLEGSVCGRVYRTGVAALCADIGLDPDYRPFPGGRTRSSLTVPIGGPSEVFAVINVEAPWVSAYSIRDYERLTQRAATALATFPLRRFA
ncbi:MAG: GAF domain-containing protein [Chloroflexi bacterium]|nr:GAF domain-containing protein [Chloroflexota bacterium]